MPEHNTISLRGKFQDKILKTALCAALTVSGAIHCSASLNPYLKLRAIALKHPELQAHSKHSHQSRTSDEDELYLPVIVKLDSETAIVPDCLNEWHRRGALVIGSVLESELNRLDGYGNVSRVECNPPAALALDMAKGFCNITQLTAPAPVGSGLTGSGVVTGFCDTGFWPHHINFIDSGGKSRVGKLVDYNTSSPYPTILVGEEIMGWTTDNTDDTHATHVAGIMAGSYAADNLQGIATEAEIVATTSQLYDAQLLAGCEEIISYAKSKQRPAVINMSISSTTGPHDGTTLFNQYMAIIGEEASVCIAAGNDAHRPCYIGHTFTSAQPIVRTYTRQWPSWSTLEAHGFIDIWGEDERPFTVNIAGFKLKDKSVAMRWEATDLLAEGEELIVCSPDLVDKFPEHAPQLLPERFSGYLYLAAEVNPENNRYNVVYYCDIKDITTDDPWSAEYMFGPEITGPEGSTIEMHSSPLLFLAAEGDPAGFTGTATRSINDLCTGSNIISAGAFTSRDQTPLINGTSTPESNLQIGTPAFYSSYGTLNNGDILPHITAPGSVVVSSNSTPYIDTHPETAANQSLSRDLNGSRYYWGHEQGTSMAAPFVAGTIALWLQANPNATPEDIREVLTLTADHPTLDTSNPQWGGGILNAKAGLDKIRQLGALPCTTIAANDAYFTFRTSDNSHFTFSCAARVETFQLCDLTGKMIQTVAPGDYEISVDCSNLSSGIYIAAVVDENNMTHSAKIAVNIKK